YVMRITGDNDEGKAQLDFFISPEERYPVIATTSKLMTTGVDAKTCKLIVLDRRIQSMTEFKQIIGRGTRIDEDYGKLYFTIMDFKKATELFADPDFDGDPVQVYQPGEGESPVPPEEGTEETNTELGTETEGEEILVDPISPGGNGGGGIIGDPGGPRKKYVVAGVTVSVVAERVQYYGPDGKLITESLKDYTRKTVLKDYKSLDDFLQAWTSAERKEAVVKELEEHGVLFEALADEVGKDFDSFDLVCHVAFDRPPLTRRERAENVRKQDYFAKYEEKARVVLEALLEKYANQGLRAIEDMDVLRVKPIDAIGTPVELVKLFGGKKGYLAALADLERALYA
ncbi:restriction endonuclease, partial [Aeoliella sp. ICT_H6.2]